MATILVVDDEPAIRLLVRAALEGAGHRLLEAGDGVRALQIARDERPDLVLLDVALPRMSGLEVCRRLRQGAARAGTPVLLLSGLAAKDERRLGEEAGAAGLIAKPFSPASLAARVEEVLASSVAR